MDELFRNNKHEGPGIENLYILNKSFLRKPPPERPLIDEEGNLQYEQDKKSNIFSNSMETQF